LENFSLPGLLIVTTHFDLLNSSEANSVILFARAVVATAVAEVTDCIGCLHAGVEAQPTKVRPPSTRIGSVISLLAGHRRPAWRAIEGRAATARPQLGPHSAGPPVCESPFENAYS
jgi:hypothetical protein